MLAPDINVKLSHLRLIHIDCTLVHTTQHVSQHDLNFQDTAFFLLAYYIFISFIVDNSRHISHHAFSYNYFM